MIRNSAHIGRLRIVFRALAIVLGGMHVYAAILSQSMNADGVSYLDIGDAYFRGDWANAINPVWSPLYSWILGFANFVIRPSMEREFPVIHLINFFIYMGALVSFEYMWGKVRFSLHLPANNGSLQLPEWLWWTLGYLLFLWTSLSLINIWAVTPDMLMAALVFLAAGLIARIRSGEVGWRLFLSLGLALGLGYLSKTFMFSIAFVFLGLAWLVQERSWKSLSRTGLAAAVFLLICLPFILLISEKKAKLTIGEAGTVTYLRYVNGMPFPHWQGDPLRGMIPAHPSRIIHEDPVVYEFGEPVGGTYPISLDPSYWYEGIEPQFDLRSLIERAIASSMVYAELFFQEQGLLVACVLTLYIMGQKPSLRFLDIVQWWALVIPAVIALGLYAVVLVQGRYIGVFVLLLWADVLANVRLVDTINNRLLMKSLGVIASAGLFLNIALFNLDGLVRLNPDLESGKIEQSLPPARPLAVAQALVELGISPGDRVGVIGYAYDSFWARLAGVKIVAEMSEEAADLLWSGDETLQKSILQSFAKAGADAVIAEYVPPAVKLQDWHQVGESSYFIYQFEE
jgi:hypothetical protein